MIKIIQRCSVLGVYLKVLRTLDVTNFKLTVCYIDITIDIIGLSALQDVFINLALYKLLLVYNKLDV